MFPLITLIAAPDDKPTLKLVLRARSSRRPVGLVGGVKRRLLGLSVDGLALTLSGSVRRDPLA
jgi:hypothetical protein